MSKLEKMFPGFEIGEDEEDKALELLKAFVEDYPEFELDEDELEAEVVGEGGVITIRSDEDEDDDIVFQGVFTMFGPLRQARTSYSDSPETALKNLAVLYRNKEYLK